MIGITTFGRTDAVPGWGYVATRFLHVGYIPLIPTAGVLILEDGAQRSVAPSWRSRLLAWGVGLGAVSLLAGLAALDLQPALAPWAIGAGLSLLALLHLPGLRRASWERAQRLADRVEADSVERIRLALAFGKISPSAAAKGIERLTPTDHPSRHQLRLDALEQVLEQSTQEKAARRERERRELEARIKRSRKAPMALALPTSSRTAIKFACPACRRTSKVPRKHAGRKGRCRHCSATLRVPSPALAERAALAATAC